MKTKITIYLIVPLLFFSCSKKNENIAIVNSKAGLIIRSEASVNSLKIDSLPFGTKVFVLDMNGPEDTLYNIKSKWCKIKFNNTTGWVFGGFLKFSIENNNNLSSNKMLSLEPEIKIIEYKHDEKTFNFNYLDKQYKIDNSGNLLCGTDNTSIKLIKEYEYIVRIFYINYKNDILLLYEITDEDIGWSKVTRIKFINNTYTKTLDVQVGGFNLTNGLIEDHFIYIATIGTIRKLDIDNGTFLWRNDDLYEKYKFNDFSDIEIKNEKVYFIEGTNPPKDTKRRKIEVNKNDGQIDVINDL